GTPFLHKGSFARGKGHFECIDYRPPAELPDSEYPFYLTTGRMYQHWLTGSMSMRIITLVREMPEGIVEINPADAKSLGVESGEPVRVISRRGTVKVKAHITDDVPKKSVFMPFHFKETPANILTSTAFDPRAKIPEFKVCAVRIEKVQ
ncbi:MAG: formate dehydrogenase subunit alpha, partial [Proteobacteria bacterium]|nr:formate dehydrogenase subunit alpha [Pseudomonadota bacterium]